MHHSHPSDNYYDIHGMTLKVDSNAAAAALIDLSLNWFRVQDNIQSANIEVLSYPPKSLLDNQYITGSGEFFYDGYSFRDKSGRFLFKVKDDTIVVSSKISFSPQLLIQLGCVYENRTLIHAAGICYSDKGILFPAWGGTGKTALISRLLKHRDVKLLGDDFVILSNNGSVFSLPLPFSLYHYHKSLFPDIFQKKKRILFGSEFLGFAKSLKRVVRPILANYPAIEAKLRNISPEYMVVPVTEIIDKNKICEKAELSKVIFLQRYSGERMIVEEADKKKLIDQIMGILQYELGESPLWKYICAMSSFGIFSFYDYYNKIHSILERSFANVECHLLLIPEEIDIAELDIKVRKIIS